VWCTVFIRWYFARRGLKFDLLSVMPGPGTVLAGAVASPLVRRVGAGEGPVTGARDAIVQLTRLAAVALPFLLLV
jgi:oligosaccharide translocation protein RFT1